MAYYEDIFTFLFNVRTSQEAHLWASTACYGIALLLHMQMKFVPDRKHTYVPLGPVAKIALFFNVKHAEV
jgi:hypothetical protein